MAYTIRKANTTDIAAIAAIYDDILTLQEKGTVTVGWVRGVYPTSETAKKALANDHLFVMEAEGVVVAAAIINRVQVPEYKDAKWQYHDIPDDEIMVLHTLVVSPFCGGKGYGTAFVGFYESYALQNGCRYLRMDTNEKNKNARRLYQKLGYREGDIVPCVFNGIEGVRLVCLEKRLDTVSPKP